MTSQTASSAFRVSAKVNSVCILAVMPIRHIVEIHWDAPVDRNGIESYQLSTRDEAERFARAVNAQAVFSDPKILTDVNGKTFVSARCNVLMRKFESEMAKLGF